MIAFRYWLRSSPAVSSTILAAALLASGDSSAFAQQHPAPALQTSIMQPSAAPPDPSHAHRALMPRTIVQSELTPVNTGPGIVYTCDPSVSAATCTYLNTTVAGYYNATFTNANANIYIQFASIGGLGSSLQFISFATYSQYTTAYGNIANKSAIQVSAQSALSTYDATPYGSDYVGITAALAGALGFSGAPGIQTNHMSCTLGTAGCYNAIVTITNNPAITFYYDNLGGAEPAGAYDFYAVAQHETDEVLGTSSCVATTNPLTDPCDQATSDTAPPRRSTCSAIPVREILSSIAP